MKSILIYIRLWLYYKQLNQFPVDYVSTKGNNLSMIKKTRGKILHHFLLNYLFVYIVCFVLTSNKKIIEALSQKSVACTL